VVIGRFNKVLRGFGWSGASTSGEEVGNKNYLPAAAFIVGIGTGENTYNEDGTLKKENRKNGLVVWGDGRVTIGKNPEETMDVATKNYVDECISNIEIPESGDSETTGEWDYVIDKLKDFTTGKLDTMRGRVLVKDVNYTPEFMSGEPLYITIPKDVSLIEFVDSTIFAYLTGSGSNKIIGFVGHNQFNFQFSSLANFGWVEKCRGELRLSNC
jgi:hypothetical protein